MRIDLTYHPPFDWRGMLAFFRSRAIPGVETVNQGVYRRTIEINQSIGTIAVSQADSETALKLKVSPSCKREMSEIVPRVRRMFDLDTDLAAIYRVLRKDPLLKKVIDCHPGLRLPGAWETFEVAVRAVVGQQISVKGARTVIGRIVARAGERLSATHASKDPTGLAYLFPTPEALCECNLNQIGMPQRRIETIRALAQAVIQGQLSFSAISSRDDFIQQMTRIPGIGDWTAQYTAMRGLGEADAFPASDLGIIKALQWGDKRPTPKQILKRAENWWPWRAYAAIYLWHL